MSLRIGHIELDMPFVQAALSGYSDVSMRRMARKFGAPYTLNEVVLDKIVLQKGRQQREILTVEPDDHPIGGQLMGANPDDFAPAAAAMAEAGYDVIDINFGCPVRKVLGRCRGGFLLSQPRTALDIVRRVIDAVGGLRPVTVKMRRGMDDAPESRGNFFEILDGAFDLGVAAATVHGRTVEQRYIGPSRWSFLAEVKRHVDDRTVLGSGDLFTAEDCIRMLNETGVDGATIARGCIGNPWIFAECRALLEGRPLPDPPSVAEQGRVIADHYAELARVYGEAKAPVMMRKFGVKYSELHPSGTALRDAFIAVRTAAQFAELLQRWYDPVADWPPVARRGGVGDLVAAGASLTECGVE